MSNISRLFDDLTVGMTATTSHLVTKEDIVAFAEVTGDCNPAHLDEDYAAGTSLQKVIAHGMLSAGFISATLGTKLPGAGSIYLKQELKFKKPVFIGETVKTVVTITSLKKSRKIVVLDTVCSVENKIIIAGKAMMMMS